MKRAFKTEIKLTDEQKHKINRTIGTCRYVYNLYLATSKKHYKDTNQHLSGYDFSKWLNNIHTKHTDLWIKDVSSKAVKQAIMNGDRAFKNFFRGDSKFPRFKKKKNGNIKAYFPKNNKTDWTIERHKVKIPTLGWIRLKEFGYVPKDQKVISGTVSKKAGRYYVSVLCEVELYDSVQYQADTEGIGIDLGIKTFAVCSNGQEFKNINKSQKMKKIEKKMKREQRSLSRKDIKVKGNESITNKRTNRNKNVLRVQKMHQRLSNSRQAYLKYVVNEVVKTKPAFITIENLNVRGMMKNRHLSKAIAEQSFFAFTTWLTAKCTQRGIELRQVNRFYPSSKLCSCCGQIKKDLKLSERIYRCVCGNEIDRDVNASINLKQAKDYVLLT